MGETVVALRYEVAAPGRTCLSEPPPEPVSESELSWIWGGQRYPAGALRLVDGRSLAVVSPGRPGLGSGPDYLDAVLEIDGARVRGDVELHVRSSGFRAHGHDTDPAYDGVALHVVFRADEGASTRLRSGAAAPVAAFAPWLEGRVSELQAWLGADATWWEPCRKAPARMGQEGVREALATAGRRRLGAKVEAMRRASEELGEDEAAWRALFDVMGTGGDREGFRRLALAFSREAACRVTEDAGSAAEGEALLARALQWVAGVADGAPEVRGLPGRLRPALSGSGRPASRPAPRLAGLAALFVRGEGRPGSWMRRLVDESPSVKVLVASMQVSRDGRALIGPDRARELVLNVALPLAAMDARTEARSVALAGELPAAPAYGKTRFLESNLRGEGKRAVRSALEQQGLLAFVGEWCSQGGCGRCPLS